MMTLAIISRHPAPYRDPLLSRLSRDGRFQVDIFNEFPLDEGHSFWDLKEHGYVAKPLFSRHEGRLGRILSLIRLFVFGRYDFVLWGGFNTFAPTFTMLLSSCFGKRFGFMADTMQQRPIGFIRRRIKSFIVRHAALILVPGKAGVSFWGREYGVEAEKIVPGVYALDGVRLAGEMLRLRDSRREIRAKYGLRETDCVFLMVANMIPTRHYPITTAGFVSFAAAHPECRFVIVGKGPELDRMREFAAIHPEIVVIPGCSFDEMVSLYAIADAYVHGGTEPASTALVIGAIAGLPIVSSDAVGCAADVLMDGVSGVKVSSYLEAESWQSAFRRLYGRIADWHAMGLKAKDLASVMDVAAVSPRISESLLDVIRCER